MSQKGRKENIMHPVTNCGSFDHYALILLLIYYYLRHVFPYTTIIIKESQAKYISTHE